MGLSLMWPSRVLTAAALAIAVMASALPGRAADDAVALVTQLCDKSMQVLGDPQLGAVDRQRRFHALVDEYFDFPVFARFVLGRYWQAASDDERQKFTVAFKDHMVRAYVSRFDDYSGGRFKVGAARTDGDRVTIVPVEILRPGTQPVLLDWRVYELPAGLRIRDVSIGGISMAITYRDEFASVVLRNNGKVAALIAALQEKDDD